MQLNSETLSRFEEGRFDDFLDDGASQLCRMFPARFVQFTDELQAQDAGRNVVGLSFEVACELGRRSGLFAMRIAFLRAAYGTDILNDPRYPIIRKLVSAQIKAAAIKPNTSIGTFLTQTRAHWEPHPFAHSVDLMRPLLEQMDVADQDWESILELMQSIHDKTGTKVIKPQLRLFATQAYKDATMIGLNTLSTIQMHTLVANGLGLQFFDDPLLPSWNKVYRSGDIELITESLKHALLGEGT